ncbi:hypothetical protein BC938DRAFT_473248 [Jimgerdemannia flammicorona]|uniref:Armadillo-type protein n=1 Tax=Jimgerdemannia flammicorona TaxID=994334 RepID=A0A433Q4M2_9FUNG|nr:hypothetical protein BC938DRAFT_473248 [Jimgerdemannia flammicorona]
MKHACAQRLNPPLLSFRRSPEDLAQVIQAGFIPVLASIATHDNFDIRKEAAFSIIHIASHGEVYMRMLPQQELLPGVCEILSYHSFHPFLIDFIAIKRSRVLDFIRSQDSELIRLGLTYLQLLLTTLPEGRKLMSSIPNAIDALESITLMEEEELRRTASALMDKYFGEDGGGGSEAGGEKGEKGEKDGLAMMTDDEYDYLFKLVLIGDSGVGKSNLLSQFTVRSLAPLSF